MIDILIYCKYIYTRIILPMCITKYKKIISNLMDLIHMTREYYTMSLDTF